MWSSFYLLLKVSSEPVRINPHSSIDDMKVHIIIIMIIVIIIIINMIIIIISAGWIIVLSALLTIILVWLVNIFWSNLQISFFPNFVFLFCDFQWNHFI